MRLTGYCDAVLKVLFKETPQLIGVCLGMKSKPVIDPVLAFGRDRLQIAPAVNQCSKIGCRMIEALFRFGAALLAGKRVPLAHGISVTQFEEYSNA